MTITNPQLPPREGFVEVEVDGIRQYAPTQKTIDNFKTEQLQNELINKIVDYEYRLTLLEV